MNTTGLILADAEAYVPFVYYMVTVLLVIFVAAIGYYVGRFLTTLKHRKKLKADERRMFDIEKALKEFWDHERARMSGENRELSKKITFLEKQVEGYRKKAVGADSMGLSKDKRTDMLMQLMLENEALEEKLYEMNLKMKDERDEHLAREFRNISYKKVMLSEILKQEGIQEKIREILKDDSQVKKMELPAGKEEDKPSSDEPEKEEKKEGS